MARVSRYFNQQDWKVTTSGTGTVTFADGGKSVVCDAPAGSAAYLLNYVVAWPGDSFEFTCLARNTETGKAGWAELIIDSNGTRRTEARVTGDTLTYYQTRYDLPLGASGPRVVIFGVGVDTPTDGSAEYVLPSLVKTRGDNSWLYGTYELASAGGCIVYPTVKSFNTDSANIVWDAVNTRYNITPTEQATFVEGAHKFKPLLLVTADQVDFDSQVVNWNIGGIQDTGGFHIQAVNNVDGTKIDLSTGAGKDLYVTVKMEL